MYKIIEIEKNKILCENLKTNKRRWVSKHHIYLKDIPKIKEDVLINIKRIRNISPKVLKSSYLVITF